MKLRALTLSAVCLFAVLQLLRPTEARAKDPARQSVTWNINNLQKIAGHQVQVLGEPQVVKSQDGKPVALSFDGVDDAIFFDVHPLAGMKEFTVEVVFRPTSGGPAAQRFFHMQESDSEDRVMFETRLTDDGRWYVDGYIKTGPGQHTLMSKEQFHPLDEWYQAAIVVADGKMRTFVDGQLELSTDIDYTPQKPGRTSLGVRINQVHWFQGEISTARFTPRALKPGEMLKAAKSNK